MKRGECECKKEKQLGARCYSCNKIAMPKQQIRARLTVYGHEDMSDKEFKMFKKWIMIVVPQTAKNKRGELSKVFRQTLYKTN